jgi:hypothetical protein
MLSLIREEVLMLGHMHGRFNINNPFLSRGGGGPIAKVQIEMCVVRGSNGILKKALVGTTLFCKLLQSFKY